MTTRKTRSSAKKKKAPVAVAGNDNDGAPDGNVDASAGANLVIAKVTLLQLLAAGTCDRMLAGLSRLISEQHRSPDLLDVGDTIHGLSSAGEGGGNVDVADLDQLRRFVQRVLENVTMDDMLDALNDEVVNVVIKEGKGTVFRGGNGDPHDLTGTKKKATKISPKIALNIIKELLGVAGHGNGHYKFLGSYDPTTYVPGAAFLPSGDGVLDWAHLGGDTNPTDAKNVRARALLFAAYLQDERPQKDPTPARTRRGGGVTFGPKGGNEDEYDEDDEDEDDDEGGDGGNGGKGRARAAAGKAGAAAAGAATAGARRTTRRSSSSTAAASNNSTSALKTKSGPGGTTKKKAPKKQASSSSARANPRGHGGDSAHARARSVSESPHPRRPPTVYAEGEDVGAALAAFKEATEEADKQRAEREARAQAEYQRIDDLEGVVGGIREDVDGLEEELQAYKKENDLQVDNLQANLQAQLDNQGDELQAQLDNQQDNFQSQLDNQQDQLTDGLADANTRSDAAAKAAAASAAVAGQASARSRIANRLARKGGKGNNGTNANPEESNRQANNGTNANTANAGDAPHNADAAQRPPPFRTSRLGNGMAAGLAVFAGFFASGYPLEGAITGGLGAGTLLYFARWLIRRSIVYRIFAIFSLASILLGYGFGILVSFLYWIMCLMCGI